MPPTSVHLVMKSSTDNVVRASFHIICEETGCCFSQPLPSLYLCSLTLHTQLEMITFFCNMIICVQFKIVYNDAISETVEFPWAIHLPLQFSPVIFILVFFSLLLTDFSMSESLLTKQLQTTIPDMKLWSFKLPQHFSLHQQCSIS